jgi:peptidoglycan/xylan/chitin deacetylase (PgdA/CDA1 family)
MPLPDEYLRYPNRGRGQDINRYAMQYAQDRDKKSLPANKTLGLSIIVPLEYFMLNPSGEPFKHPGAMATPYPDLRHYTTRDYGNRVGVFRLLKAFKDANAKATFAVNAVLLDRMRPLIDAILEDGHEIAAHGWDTDSIHWSGTARKVEEEHVSKTRQAFDKAGLNPRAWMSPARQQSFATPDLIRAADFDICLDWEMDTVPVAMKTNSGNLHAFPVLNELSDWFILQTKHHTEDEWREQILEGAAMTASEAPRYGAQCFGFTMTPYIAGQPFRMWAVREILAALANDETILLAGVSDIVDTVQ